MRVNRGIIKLVKSSGGDFNDYRLYLIARTHFAHRSGIFSLAEFLDILNMHYGYTSLHRQKGNDRKGFASRCVPMMERSVLFTILPDGRYKANAERKLLTGTHAKRSSWFQIEDESTMLSKRLFADFCVGVLLAGNKFRANKNISNQLGCTVRRIQYATSRNHKGFTFHKQYNYIEVAVGSHKEVMRTRAVLLSEHGITTPLPRRTNAREWVLNLNAPNSYRAIVLSGVKGHKAQPTGKTMRKEDSWFQMRPEEKRIRHLYLEETPCKWTFNEKRYHYGRYITDHSMQFDRETPPSLKPERRITHERSSVA